MVSEEGGKTAGLAGNFEGLVGGLLLARDICAGFMDGFQGFQRGEHVVATSEARSGMSYQRRVISGILTCWKRFSSGRQIANVTALTMRPPVSVH